MGHGGPSPGPSLPCVEGTLPGLSFCNTQLSRLSAVGESVQLLSGELTPDFPSYLVECRTRAGQGRAAVSAGRIQPRACLFLRRVLKVSCIMREVVRCVGDIIRFKTKFHFKLTKRNKTYY